MSNAYLVFRIAAGTILAGLGVAGLFWLAGDFRWARGWLYVGTFAVCQSASGLVLLVTSPELVRRRGRPGAGTKAWDAVCLSLFGLAYLGILVVAALDARLRWSSVMPPWTAWAGIALYVPALAFLTWAMSVNTHFEKTVRIQTDRGHRVIDAGPYRVVRHPGYVGTILGWILAAPLILGSWWALVPAGAGGLCLIVRTALEDRTLRRELPGYEDYARRVRHRLVPGIW